MNGFFPITNYVLHRTSSRCHTSDTDVLAVRFPYVYEDIGGQPGDWDVKLAEILDFRLTVGVICEVKAGKYSRTKLFPVANIDQSIDRLGFFQDASEAKQAMLGGPIYNAPEQYQISKLLIADHLIADRPSNGKAFFFLSLAHVRRFMKQRMNNYKENKHADRMFFPSAMLQEMIAEI